ncbi:MAG: flagellar motor switch protein FliM, partial [Myxococcota bacterium]
MENVLSQNEVNALLDAVRTGSVPTEDGQAPAVEIRDYDLTSNGRIVRGRMPTLDMINQRLARLMRQSIFNLFRKPVEVTHKSTELVKYG